MTKDGVVGLVAGLLIGWSGACTNMLPMSEWHVTDKQVAQLQGILGTDVPTEVIRDPKIHYQHSVTVPCSELMAICYPPLPFWQKAIGGIPLACTRFYQHAWRDEKGKITETAKTAISYSCWLTPGLAKSHEAEHREGKLHQ